MTNKPVVNAGTSSPASHETNPLPILWGASDSAERGPIIATLSNPERRNVLGVHGGQFSLNRSMAVAAGMFNPTAKPNLTDTYPTDVIGPFPQWFEPGKIVTLDPFGANVTKTFAGLIAGGYDIRPTIAITRAVIRPPEIREAVEAGRLEPDGVILKAEEEHRNGKATGKISHACPITEIAIDPVWHLPGIADRLGISELDLRRTLVEQTGGMYADLVTRRDLQVFLPPIGQTLVIIFGDVKKLSDPKTNVTVRVHDACIGSDVLSSDVCCCRPYLTHAFEECVQCAQKGGVGVIVYFDKEGRGLGAVTKLMVYNKRKRQPGGDTADRYFVCTEQVAGFRDARFQQFMPDPLHWLGLRKIRLVSMSNDKFDAIVRSGIEVVERIEIPEDLVPADAHVEIEAKKASGYYTKDKPSNVTNLNDVRGRPFT
jgi:GTP cyclohydrolase II